MTGIYLNQLGIICALGQGRPEIARNLFSANMPSSMSFTDQFTPGYMLTVGQVHAALPALSDFEIAMHSRNNQLLAAAAAQIQSEVEALIYQFGAERIAVVLGTSTSGVGECEYAHRYRLQNESWPERYHYQQQEIGAPAVFLSRLLGTRGISHVISTACSSSAKAIASAARLILAGLADAAICGGADSLCGFTISGFKSLDSISTERCIPFSRNRHGINIGEGAALFVMSRNAQGVCMMGWGETSDAHHMSAPDPSGNGAAHALKQALQHAKLQPSQIDYVNLHGTATLQNDAMEACAVHEALGDAVPCSSSKPIIGHTLGAAGAIEAGLCWLALTENPDCRLPPHWYDGVYDASLPRIRLAQANECADAPLQNVISQSFAFGGSNVALCLGRVA